MRPSAVIAAVLGLASKQFDPGQYNLGPERLVHVDFFGTVDVSAGVQSIDLLAASARTSPDLVESFSTANSEPTPNIVLVGVGMSVDLVTAEDWTQQHVMLARQNLFIKHQSQGTSAKRYIPVRLAGQTPGKTSQAAITGPAYAYGQTIVRDNYKAIPGGTLPVLMWTDTLTLEVDQSLSTLPGDFAVNIHLRAVAITRQHFESNHASRFVTNPACG